ncbi:uncharacterized mitochondrial protein AtMg00810-like [Rutidosis leptorrhynchoides]|uniref:uncharacterized mitochondrial protein AtMg00810-like n=1 Tax=Rutidosis leptorrhynchoides TaxID=125765 RepID=UPI003A9982DC
MFENGFSRGVIDQTLFIKKKGQHLLLVPVYVDDIIFGSTDQAMVDEFEKHFQADTKRPAKAPLSVNHGISPDYEGAKVDPTLYRAIIGSLMYLTASRPDIMFVVCLCAIYKANPNVHYIDSDYGGCKKDFKSTSGGCQFLGSKLVTWQCKKQTTVAQSTCEAEYD